MQQGLETTVGIPLGLGIKPSKSGPVSPQKDSWVRIEIWDESISESPDPLVTLSVVSNNLQPERCAPSSAPCSALEEVAGDIATPPLQPRPPN
ncbi:hypothetical protein GN956_G9125 [Arapaima gigas]